MKKVKFIKGKWNDILTNEFRELVEKKLGKIDTATSFMYMFRRFGVPSFDNKDEYKILYDYRFLFRDIFVTVHASYHEHVYLSLSVKSSHLKRFFAERKSFLKRISKQSMDRHIAFMPYQHLWYGFHDVLTKRQYEKNWEIIDREGKIFFSKEDIKLIDDSLSKDKECRGNAQEAFKMLRPFEKYLCNKFRRTLSQKDRSKLNKSFPSLSDVPELRKQALEFIQELKKGIYVRDVEINILGYATENNKISKYVKE